MAYDAYGRLQRGNEEPGYFESNDSHMPGHSSQYNAEPRDNLPSRPRDSSFLRQSGDTMTAVPDRTESSGTDVSAELIAAITERVKKERTFNTIISLSPG
jgi:hypothetical protein